jgi:hypothetical protein
MREDSPPPYRGPVENIRFYSHPRTIENYTFFPLRTQTVYFTRPPSGQSQTNISKPQNSRKSYASLLELFMPNFQFEVGVTNWESGLI